MAKLNKDMQGKVDNASDSFDPIPAGVYHVRLRDVDTDRSGGAGPYWSWEFEVVEDEHTGRRLWNNTSLADSALFSLKNTFKAFGVDTDADTDDLCGQVVKAVVSIRTIQQGARKGELANQIDRLLPADEDFEPATEAAATSGKKAEDIF